MSIMCNGLRNWQKWNVTFHEDSSWPTILIINKTENAFQIFDRDNYSITKLFLSVIYARKNVWKKREYLTDNKTSNLGKLHLCSYDTHCHKYHILHQCILFYRQRKRVQSLWLLPWLKKWLKWQRRFYIFEGHRLLLSLKAFWDVQMYNAQTQLYSIGEIGTVLDRRDGRTDNGFRVHYQININICYVIAFHFQQVGSQTKARAEFKIHVFRDWVVCS